MDPTLKELQERVEQLGVERLRLIGLLEEHLSPDLVREILQGETQLTLGGTRETVAVLFCDLRGFTRFTASEAPADVVAHLNQFFHAMTSVLFRHGATLDKFIGDAILAYFKPRGESPRDLARRAADCAFEMRERFGALSAEWSIGRGLGLGIGLSIGEVILGCVGSGKHVDYTVVGTPVNLAARLCAAAGPGEIFAAGSFVEAIGFPRGWLALPLQSLKGFEEPVKAFSNAAVR